MEVFKIEPKANNTNSLEVINTIMMSVGLFFLSALIPFFIFVIPAPSVVLSIKKGYKYGLLSMFVVGIVAVLMSRTANALVLLLYMVPIVVLMSSMIKQGESFKKIMFVNIFATLFITLIALLNVHFVLKVDIIETINEFFAKAAKFANENLPSAGFTEPMVKQMVETTKFMKYLLPSMVVLYAIALNYGSFAFTKKLLNKNNMELASKQNFRFVDFRINFKFLAVMLLTGIGIYVLDYFKVPYAKEITYNFVAIYSVLLVFAGIALVDYYLVGKAPKILRILIPVLLMFLFSGHLLYILVATVDIFINFRKRFKRVENENK